MKKLFAFILLLASLSAGCIFPTLGTFAMSSTDNSAHEGMNHDMGSHEGMDMGGENDSEHMHECCESPFGDSLSHSNGQFSSKDDSDVDNDTEILLASHENIFQNTTDRLNSPPKFSGDRCTVLKNTYTSLIGIIKNNA